ncbi:hypothetical protein FALBO_8903 [Fusarium albosuccineum]|uniref:Uncharacterized protein n=1 Tax=Fusarium albosuccineum TaxID=1237068 RepID=A0A8H4P9H3_9HYPO|nr:hypothetical protein FALBO_8903 [Fusarium albosuccineum]
MLSEQFVAMSAGLAMIESGGGCRGMRYLGALKGTLPGLGTYQVTQPEHRAPESGQQPHQPHRNQNTGLQNQVNNLTNRVATLEHGRHKVFTLRENLERLERSIMRAFTWIHHCESIHGGLPDVPPGGDHNTGGETDGEDENMVDRDAGNEHGETGAKDGETAGGNDEAQKRPNHSQSRPTPKNWLRDLQKLGHVHFRGPKNQTRFRYHIQQTTDSKHPVVKKLVQGQHSYGDDDSLCRIARCMGHLRHSYGRRLALYEFLISEEFVSIIFNVGDILIDPIRRLTLTFPEADPRKVLQLLESCLGQPLQV